MGGPSVAAHVDPVSTREAHGQPGSGIRHIVVQNGDKIKGKAVGNPAKKVSPAGISVNRGYMSRD